ncbi:MAG: EAL domain-containing protein [Gammaproteobacteria bacterium]|nr:EAL domain-containing protein [Gammaproteobacteria bacterium]
MLLNQISIRMSLIIGMTVVGLLGVFFLLASGISHRDVSMAQSQAVLGEQVKTRLIDLRRELEAESQRIALLASAEPGLLQSVKSGKTATIVRHLDQAFDRPGATSSRISLAKLQVLDQNLNTQASSGKGVPESLLEHTNCVNLRAVAAKRKGAEIQKPISSVCIAEKNIFHLLIQLLGESPASGFLLVATDMTPRLTAVDGLFNMPVRLTYPDGSLLYRSANWPRDDELKNFLFSEQPFGGVRTIFQVSVSQDVRGAVDAWEQVEHKIIGSAIFALLLAGLLVWFILQKTAIKPLRMLVTQLRKARSDKNRLGEHVVVAGNTEVAELGSAFNSLTTQLKELYESLESLAFTDPLTKLPNRTLFHDRLEQAIEDAKRDYKPFALFLMDLDRFKDINDTLGHQVGDLLLQQVAARLRSKLRDIDTVARMGGDEFAILLPAVNEKHATMAARMLLQALRAPFQIEEQSLDIGASIGIALYPDHGVDANILIQRSDVAMYSAKHANSGHAFYDGNNDQHNPTHLMLLGELRHAVEQEQFVLYYQPKVDLKNYQVTGVEALVRWKHPREDLMLPDTFIPLLEQTGLIRSLTPWVLNESLRQGQELQEQGVPITISMNLSVRDLQDPYLADAFAEQLAALQISPRWLELEITESAVMTEPERALNVLSRLSAMGLRIAIDDFGTGYSSLSYLKKLPVNTIKIDKSFVIGMVRDDNDAAIVHTSVNLAHNLKLEVVAEGVENEETLTRLIELGCDIAQGHYISRPLSAEELSVWLKQSSWALKRNPKLVRLHK